MIYHIDPRNGARLRINEAYASTCPNNCPVIEQNADGSEVGVCARYIGRSRRCERHGVIEALHNAPQGGEDG